MEINRKEYEKESGKENYGEKRYGNIQIVCKSHFQPTFHILFVKKMYFRKLGFDCVILVSDNQSQLRCKRQNQFQMFYIMISFIFR